jgi:hypothetical protein
MRMETEVMKASSPKLPAAGGPRSSRTKPLSFEDFTPDTEMSENQRAAQFLDWCARNMPGRFVPYVWITQHAYVKPKLPRLDSEDVNTLRKKRMDSVKKILWSEYHRRTVSSPRDQEPGVRATTDSDDLRLPAPHAPHRQRREGRAGDAREDRRHRDAQQGPEGDGRAHGPHHEAARQGRLAEAPGAAAPPAGRRGLTRAV